MMSSIDMEEGNNNNNNKISSNDDDASGSMIDNDFFAKLVDDLFLDNEYFTFPNSFSTDSLNDSSSSSSSSSSTTSYVALSSKNELTSSIENNGSCLSPFSQPEETSQTPIAYPAPAPLAILPSVATLRKRSRDIQESNNLFSFDQIASKVSSVEAPAKKKKETNGLSAFNGEEKPKKNFIGVTYHAPSNRFRARIKIDNKTTHLGYFVTEYEAAVAYDRAAWELRGTKAHLNFDAPNVSSFVGMTHANLPIRDRCIAAAKSAAGVVPGY